MSSNKRKVKSISKNGEEIAKPVSYKLQLIDIAKFMASSLSNVVDNLAEAIQKIKCKYEHDYKKCKEVELNTKIVSEYHGYEDLECVNVKDDLIV